VQIMTGNGAKDDTDVLTITVTNDAGSFSNGCSMPRRTRYTFAA